MEFNENTNKTKQIQCLEEETYVTLAVNIFEKELILDKN